MVRVPAVYGVCRGKLQPIYPAGTLARSRQTAGSSQTSRVQTTSVGHRKITAPDSKAIGAAAPTFWFYSLDVVEIDLVPVHVLVPLALLSPRQDRVEVWL